MSYALIAVRAPKSEVQAALKTLNRHADLLEEDGYTVVQDRALAAQDLLTVLYSGVESDLEKLAREVSHALKVAVFATLNFESEVLAFFAFSSGVLLSQYNSSPNYLACSTTPPVAENVEELAALFDKPENARAIAQLLGRKRGLGFVSELQRHGQLAALLGLPRSSVDGVVSSAV